MKNGPLDLRKLNDIDELAGVAVVSYFFAIDEKLYAFVWRKGNPVARVELPITKDEAAQLANETREKVRSKVFFKKDGKRIFEKLLAPLSLNAQHLIIVPDGVLWKIPFQALSPDGDHYLIESSLVSYAPSLASLQDMLSEPAMKRRSIQVFANDRYGGRFLAHVNPEAERLARLFGTRPLLNATVGDFLTNAASADILHFSMHAELNNEQPLESFLAFRPARGGSGQLTVHDLLKMRLKKRSLAFLASCDTNNIIEGEGVVNIAWAMMGSGATSIVSSQWEADDKSTEMFSAHFYDSLLGGNSPAKSIQSAAVAMIKDKNAETHEPYYWAAFTLLGDHR